MISYSCRWLQDVLTDVLLRCVPVFVCFLCILFVVVFDLSESESTCTSSDTTTTSTTSTTSNSNVSSVSMAAPPPPMRSRTLPTLCYATIVTVVPRRDRNNNDETTTTATTTTTNSTPPKEQEEEEEDDEETSSTCDSAEGTPHTKNAARRFFSQFIIPLSLLFFSLKYIFFMWTRVYTHLNKQLN